MIRAIFFIGVGLLLGGAVASFIGAPGAGIWALSAGLTVAPTALILWGMGAMIQGLQSVNPQLVSASVKAGRLGLARIDSFRETNTRINDQPVCEVELTVQPLNGRAFRTKMKRTLSIWQIAGLSPSTEVPVAILVEGQPDVSFIPEGDSVESKVEKVQRLRVPSKESAGELLTPKPGKLRANGKRIRPLVGTGKRGRPLRVLLFVVLVLVGITAVLLPMRDTVALSVESKKITGSWKPDMRADPGISAGLKALEEHLGHDQILNAGLYKDYIFIDAPIGPDTLNTDRWQYRGGKISNYGPVGSQPESADEFFSYSDVQWGALWPAAETVLTGASDEVTDDITMNLKRGSNDDFESERFMESIEGVEVRFTLDEPYSSTAYVMDAQGKNLAKY